MTEELKFNTLPKLALSVRQPWVHCIFSLGKPVENRTWATKFRGPVCIHAAKGMTKDEWLDGLYGDFKGKDTKP